MNRMASRRGAARSTLSACLRCGLFFCLCCIAGTAFASHKERACLKYRVNYGWSQGYKVTATVISGADLNTAVGSYTRFKAYGTYAVVFWDEGQASIFELPAYDIDQLPIIATRVEDQEGREWEISQDNGVCF